MTLCQTYQTTLIEIEALPTGIYILRGSCCLCSLIQIFQVVQIDTAKIRMNQKSEMNHEVMPQSWHNILSSLSSLRCYWNYQQLYIPCFQLHWYEQLLHVWATESRADSGLALIVRTPHTRHTLFVWGAITASSWPVATHAEILVNKTVWQNQTNRQVSWKRSCTEK